MLRPCWMLDGGIMAVCGQGLVLKLKQPSPPSTGYNYQNAPPLSMMTKRFASGAIDPPRPTQPHPIPQRRLRHSRPLATRTPHSHQSHFPEHTHNTHTQPHAHPYARSQIPPPPAHPIDTLSHIPPPFASPPARPAPPPAVPLHGPPETHRMDQVILLRQGKNVL